MPVKITMEDLKQKLAGPQYKLTPQRKIVLQIFLDRPSQHLSAEDVHFILNEQKCEIGLATVYRSLELLSDLNILNYLDFGDGCRRYELNDASPNEHQHHHLICIECGKVLEFTDDLLGNLEEKIEDTCKFKIVDHQLKFFGYCEDCQKKREMKS